MATLFGIELPEPQVEMRDNGDSVMVLRQNGRAVGEFNFSDLARSVFGALLAPPAPQPQAARPDLKVVR